MHCLIKIAHSLLGLRRQNCDRGDGCANVAQLSSLLGRGRGVRLGHRGRQTLWVFILQHPSQSAFGFTPCPFSADVVTLTLTHSMSPWRVPAGFNCSEYFFLDVRDGADANAPVLGHYCTNTVPPSITSSASETSNKQSTLLSMSLRDFRLRPLPARRGVRFTQRKRIMMCVVSIVEQVEFNFSLLLLFQGNTMRVTYRVPRHNSGSVGFRALYSVEDSACGGEITAPSGRFTSPSYPDRYVDR